MLGAVALARGWVRPTRSEWVRIVVIGVLWFCVYNLALNEGETRVDAGTAAMLLQVSPILIALLAAAFLGERFNRFLAAGLALAFAGVALIGTASSPGGDRDLVGVGLCLVSALAYSISLILQKPLVARLPAVQVTWLACTVGALCSLPFTGSLLDEAAAAPTSSVLWTIYLGVFPTAIAFTTYAYALRHMSASNLGPFARLRRDLRNAAATRSNCGGATDGDLSRRPRSGSRRGHGHQCPTVSTGLPRHGH